ncbi:hypothetical protein SUDANB95_07891 (plasmid) [Actinosynnema sp. ALI-1.44]
MRRCTVDRDRLMSRAIAVTLTVPAARAFFTRERMISFSCWVSGTILWGAVMPRARQIALTVPVERPTRAAISPRVRRRPCQVFELRRAILRSSAGVTGPDRPRVTPSRRA